MSNIKLMMTESSNARSELELRSVSDNINLNHKDF